MIPKNYDYLLLTEDGCGVAIVYAPTSKQALADADEWLTDTCLLREANWLKIRRVYLNRMLTQPVKAIRMPKSGRYITLGCDRVAQARQAEKFRGALSACAEVSLAYLANYT